MTFLMALLHQSLVVTQPMTPQERYVCRVEGQGSGAEGWSPQIKPDCSILVIAGYFGVLEAAARVCDVRTMGPLSTEQVRRENGEAANYVTMTCLYSGGVRPYRAK